MKVPSQLMLFPRVGMRTRCWYANRIKPSTKNLGYNSVTPLEESRHTPYAKISDSVMGAGTVGARCCQLSIFSPLMSLGRGTRK